MLLGTGAAFGRWRHPQSLQRGGRIESATRAVSWFTGGGLFGLALFVVTAWGRLRQQHEAMGARARHRGPQSGGRVPR
jgi:hypothetical protein